MCSVPLEREIQQEIREALGLEPGLLLWRNNVGSARHFDTKTHKESVVRYGLANGSADLVGLLAPTGRFFALEVKKPGEAPTKEQAQWAALVRKFGGFCATVRSVEEARAAVERARAGGIE